MKKMKDRLIHDRVVHEALTWYLKSLSIIDDNEEVISITALEDELHGVVTKEIE